MRERGQREKKLMKPVFLPIIELRATRLAKKFLILVLRWDIMGKSRRIQEILEILRDDQRCLDQSVSEIKLRATGLWKRNTTTTSTEFTNLRIIKGR